MVKILFFFNLVDLLGRNQEELVLPAEIVNVDGLLALLGQRIEGFHSALSEGRGIQITINKKFAELSSPIQDGDEVALFPKR